MKRSVVLHRRVQKKLREKALPHDQVSKCVRLLCEGQTDHLGLRMKRLKGVDRPVFEARVNRDVRLIFTIQPAHEYGGANGGTGRSDGNHLRDRIVVWDVDHHDDALSAARRISYDSLHQAEELCLASSLHEQGTLEEIAISKLPDYPTVPLSTVEREVKTGKSVLNQYIRPHYRGEEWWLEQALSVEQESLYDAQEFLEIDMDRIEQEIEHLAQSDEDFLLHLLPEQMEFVRKPGPLLLSGTVGSGKTTILLYHLYRQARANPAGRYLVVTYSPTLTSLCQLLFEHLPEGRTLLQRVDILSYEDLLYHWFPHQQVVIYAERRRQFHEAYQRAKRVWRQGNLKEPLRSWKRRHREFPWDEERLWAEYWDVIKGQLNWQTRQLLDREGYLHNAASNLQPEEREVVFAAIETWFRLGGQDELDLSRDLWEQPKKVVASYDGVYVDEIQDLCEVQWMLLMRLVRHPTGLFLTGDPFQALRPSGFHWNRLVSRISQEVTVQEGSLKLNLRNSRQIALFVQGELERIKREYDLDEMPDYHVTALLDGLPPVAATLDSPALSARRLAEWLGDQGAVIVWDTADEGHPFAQELRQQGVLLCSVEEAKGLEFDRVILLNVYSQMHTQMRQPPVLRQQAFSRLYVALTRARRGLVVVEDNPRCLPPSLPKLSEQWLNAWEVVETVVVRSYEALKNPSNWTEARRMERSGRLVEAAELYEGVRHYSNAARCYEQAKDYSNAARCYEQARDYSNAARCYEQAQNYGKAAWCYEQAKDYSNAARCYEQTQDYPNAAWCYEQAKDYPNAARCYEQTGRTRDAARCWGRLNEQQGKWLEAGQWFEKAGLLAEAAGCYEQAKDYARAAACYARSKEYVNAARCYEQVKDYARAAACYAKSNEYVNAAQCYEKVKDYASAARCYEQAQDYANAARCYERAGMPIEAGRLYERAGNMHDAARCYQKYVQDLVATLDWPRAVADAERMVQVKKLSWEDTYLLIALYKRLKAGCSHTVYSNDGTGAAIGLLLGAAIGELLFGLLGVLLGGFLGAAVGSAGSGTSRTVTLEADPELLAKIEAKLAQHGYEITE